MVGQILTLFFKMEIFVNWLIAETINYYGKKRKIKLGCFWPWIKCVFGVMRKQISAVYTAILRRIQTVLSPMLVKRTSPFGMCFIVLGGFL